MDFQSVYVLISDKIMPFDSFKRVLEPKSLGTCLNRLKPQMSNSVIGHGFAQENYLLIVAGDELGNYYHEILYPPFI